ncbi:MAG: tetratricopeptide repeat protein [Alphaproteobacteria bacterium]|nr:tetratricopeptide repeat protein [Alphaproteobacteria bacterium]
MSDQKEAAERLGMTEQLLRQSKYWQAEKVARSILDTQPLHPQALLGLAVALLGVGRVDEAAHQLDKAAANGAGAEQCAPWRAQIDTARQNRKANPRPMKYLWPYQTQGDVKRANDMMASGDVEGASNLHREILRLVPHEAHSVSHFGAQRPNYFYGVSMAARLAKMLGYEAVSVIEFGVAAGDGFRSLEQSALFIQDLLEIEIKVFGFDLGEGLPTPVDYRDASFVWQAGEYKMDHDFLRQRLVNAELILGEVSETIKSFTPPKGAPVGFCSFDLDYYSSTMSAFDILRRKDACLPRVCCYFDDIISHFFFPNCEFIGELAAIEDFNKESETRKIARINKPQNHLMFPIAESWHPHIFYYHDFAHPQYNTYAMPEPLA